MAVHLYASLVPEALIASMLEPEEFGAYYAVGTEKKAREQALFVEIDPAFHDPFFKIDEGIARCVPTADGAPKRSVYISVYRVLEHLPVSALGSLYLATNDGRVAELPKAEAPETSDTSLHLYQEICPVNPLVVSTKGPAQFYRFMAGSEVLFPMPALYFAELRLGELADDPERGDSGNLPYSNMDHLRQCLAGIRTKQVATKIVNRNHPAVFPYRTVSTGFYFGQGQELTYYPMPPKADLLSKYYSWWRSAQM